MASIVFLAHRMPYPPDKGDKITTFNYLKHLAREHEVHVGAFVDDKEDEERSGELSAYCASLRLVPISPRWRKLSSAAALLTSSSITSHYYRSSALRDWARQTVERTDSRHLLVYCSAMAPFFAGERFAGRRRVAQFGDVDSDKWRLYAEKASGAMRALYAREARTLLAFERKNSADYDVTAFAAEGDAALYRKLAPEVADRVAAVPNGVDTEYFDPTEVRDSPYTDGEQAIAFTGVMDYWANVDAVEWFANEVFPLIRAQAPQATFWIVGTRPTAAVRALEAQPGVRVTGRVPDVRPFLAHARAVVAPLRIARGIQNKVLEAMAMARPVLLTSPGAGGLTRTPLIESRIHDVPEAMARAVTTWLPKHRDSQDSRDYVIQHNSWHASIMVLKQLLQLP